ncbi:MAG TPA: hypothetical protein VLB04_08045 [Methanotrichaceae archaeon]|nr:hypothetical protein [Methanotrichaceae archaeon]
MSAWQDWDIDNERPSERASWIRGEININLQNTGRTSAARVEIKAATKPSEGLEGIGLERSFFEILPGEEESYSAELRGRKAGNYIITLRASFQVGNGTSVRKAKAEVVVLEREYKYLYLLIIISVAAIIAWLYRRHQEYKY